MRSRYEITLNGMSLSSISADILILDINNQPSHPQDDVFTIANRHGSQLFRRYFDSKAVRITFEIHAYSIRKRQAICSAICAWAKNGGVLQTNDRDGQYLQCVCTDFPVIDSAKNWLDPLTMTFTAREIPFWQEIVPVSASFTGTSGNGSIYVPGNVDDALVEVSVKANAPLTSVDLTSNGRTLTLSGISVAADETILISYDSNAIQSIKKGTTSLLSKRTGATDLTAKCGENNTFAFSSDASADVRFSVKGWWM